MSRTESEDRQARLIQQSRLRKASELLNATVAQGVVREQVQTMSSRSNTFKLGDLDFMISVGTCRTEAPGRRAVTSA